MSKLLINENPLMVLPSLAVKIGLNEAIVLQQIHFWISLGTCGKNVDGVIWIYNTSEDWLKQFPFFSERTLKRVIKKLKDSGIILVEQFNKNDWDRTNFYTINYSEIDGTNDSDNLASSSAGQNGTSDKANMALSSYSTETTTEITPEKKQLKKQKYPSFVKTGNEKKIFDYRKSIKKPLKTIAGLNGLMNAVSNCMKEWNASFDSVLEEMANNEWMSIKPDYRTSINIVTSTSEQGSVQSSVIPAGINLVNPGALKQ